MFWPTSITEVQKLPTVQSLEELSKSENHTYKSNPHDDDIIDILSNYSNGLPYVILTYRSIYLFDWTHKAPVNVHIRSNESIEKFGSNISVKLSPNQQTYAIKTDKNVILMYTIKATGSDSELLGIYSNSGTLIQNGYPLTQYETDPYVYGGFNSKFSLKSNDQKNGIVKNILSTFMGIDGNEIPIVDLGLRLKLILNVASPIVEYCFIGNMELLLINTNPHAFQVIHLNSKTSNGSNTLKENNNLAAESNSNITFILADELDWFNNPNINDSNEILDMDYNYDLDCFLWFNTKGDALLVKRAGNDVSLELTAKSLYKCESKDFQVIKGLINHFKNTIYLLLENGDLLIYKLYDDLSSKLLKTVRACLPAKGPCGLYLTPHGDSFIVLYKNGWNVFSSLGNQNFSTFEYDQLNISNIKKIQFLSEKELVLINNINEIIYIDLTVYSIGQGFNSLSIKRPLLYDRDKIMIFKAYEKKLVDHHHYNYNLDDITNRSTDVWFTELLPLHFRINNNIIRSCSVSEDGNNVCIVGNYDVIIFSVLNQKWKFLEKIEDSATFEKNEILVKKCCWWKNYLILGSSSSSSMTVENSKKSEITVFSEKVLDDNESFSVEFIVWNFNFENTPFNEAFVNFNVDSHNDLLFVMSDHLNCYTWKLKLKTEVTAKINGDYISKNGGLYDSSMKTLKSSITFEKSIVYQLKSCFKETDESIILNYGTILMITDTDLLFLSNTDLYYIRREREKYTMTFKYVTYLINDCVEYVHKLNNSLICLFDGSQLIHYNLSDNIDLLKLKPIKISIGNDIIQDSTTGHIMKYIGTCPYPLTTIAYQNVLFGIEIECFNKLKLKLETTRRNYLADLVNHYILSNVSVKVLEDDSNAINIATVYGKFSRFKNFKYVLEKLMVDYLQNCYDHKDYDTNDEYFNRLYALINLAGNSYEIILNCLKKTETHFWPLFFKKADETPRYVVNQLFTESDDQKLTAHYFIIMLNYEKYDNQQKTDDKNKNKKKGKSYKESISTADQDLIVNILKKLVLARDFDTSFELVRFMKIVDDKMMHKCLEKMKIYLKN
ncbi:hypothetical protein C6P40_004500 [Pichia californica]|uniref:RIC1 C-terminal alpha solenoid region domain-containing protein n=1 Tax=Pichia californica TaxID=460514 RepID=A0A9P6WMH2_9ASCO|nr:hypothetical protein C6P42_004975 [[Candida] californica]KAG0689787.1 hypothetical protein C6P40_004500 [[Candida] californica]